MIPQCFTAPLTLIPIAPCVTLWRNTNVMKIPVMKLTKVRTIQVSLIKGLFIYEGHRGTSINEWLSKVIF